jgi:hypothetical protein
LNKAVAAAENIEFAEEKIRALANIGNLLSKPTGAINPLRLSTMQNISPKN